MSGRDIILPRYQKVYNTLSAARIAINRVMRHYRTSHITLLLWSSHVDKIADP